jgi:hypothetical protein
MANSSLTTHILPVSLAVAIALGTAPSAPAQRGNLALGVTTSTERIFLGLVELPWIYPANGPGPDEPLTAHARPASDAEVVALLDSTGVRAPDGRQVCGWVRDLDRVSGVPRGCEFVEADYEVPALRVYEQRDSGWLLVELTGPTVPWAWIRTSGEFHSLVDLLAGGEHLTYLDLRRWDRLVFETPGGTSTAFRHPALVDRQEVPYEALGHAVRDGRLWLHVRILDDACGARDPIAVGHGWIPARTANGGLNAWFWSRGC